MVIRRWGLVAVVLGMTLPDWSADRVPVAEAEQILAPPGSAADAIEGGSLRAVKLSKTTVQYRDGQEIAEPGAEKAATTKTRDEGLKTWGAFGPVLGLVLVDAAENKLAWSHWEQGASGPVAVSATPFSETSHITKYAIAASPRPTAWRA